MRSVNEAFVSRDRGKLLFVRMYQMDTMHEMRCVRAKGLATSQARGAFSVLEKGRAGSNEGSRTLARENHKIGGTRDMLDFPAAELRPNYSSSRGSHNPRSDRSAVQDVAPWLWAWTPFTSRYSSSTSPDTLAR